MAYHKANFLQKVLEVQNVFLEHKKEDVYTRTIYKTIIRPRFLISLSTFYSYMAINAKKELRKLESLNKAA